MEKPLKDCDPRDLRGSPMNLYLYAVTVLNGRLPPEEHGLMERLLRENPDEHVVGYFRFLSRRTLWGRIRAFLGA
jgi:hypothetical protein